MAILQGLHRTNNDRIRELAQFHSGTLAVEGWYCEFNNMFTSAHPAMDKFVALLQNDEDKNRQRLVR